MRVWIFSLIVAACSWPLGGAQAENVALIYGDEGLSPFFQTGEALPEDLFSAPLEEADFTIVQPDRRDAAAMRRAAQEVQQMLDSGAVERLLIVVTGPFASNARDNWALSNDAIGASSITIGATGMSINALADMAQHSGRGALILATGRPPKSIGSGLLPGLGDITSVGDVTYFTGEAGPLAEVLKGGLLSNGTSYAELAASLPSGVRISGYVPSDAGFMGAAGSEGDARMKQAGYWQAVRDIDTIEAYRLYLRAYPGGANRALAEERITYIQGAPLRQAKADEEKLGLSEAAKKGIQTDLRTLGLYTFGIDGRLGKGSRAAIAAWQRRSGLDETGYITGNQLFSLREDAKTEVERQMAEAAEAEALKKEKDTAYWSETGEDGSEPGLRAYLSRYPEGAFAEEARGGLAKIEEGRRTAQENAERRAWRRARSADTPDDYIAFLEAFPSGVYAAQAQTQLDAFQGVPSGPDDVARAQAEESDLGGSGISRLMIERRLDAAGAQPGAVDGHFDGQTREAIRWYQDSRALPVTGYLSRATVLRLMAGR